MDLLRANRKQPPRDHGAALVVALFAVTILTALVVAFAAIARTDALLAANGQARRQAFFAARSGIQYCRRMLADDGPGVDWTGESWAAMQQGPLALDIPGSTVEVELTDESGRLNVNTATREMLLALPGVTEQVADSILDWREPAHEPRPNGAESDYYLSLPSPYQAANRPFQTMEELRLVRGVDDGLWFGGGAADSPGLRDLLTVLSGEENRDRQGRRRLNLNTADPGAMTSRLGDILTPADLAAIQRRRRQGPLRSLADACSIPGVSWRKMAQALDRIRVDDRTFLAGTVNLNTAGEQVLEAIGLPAEAAQAAVDRRSSQPFETKGDLAEVPGVNASLLRSVADRIAVKSSIFRVMARGRAEDRPLAVSMWALLDRRTSPPRIALWREQPDQAQGSVR